MTNEEHRTTKAKTHYYTEQPKYESRTGALIEDWQESEEFDRSDIDHTVERNHSHNEADMVIDIETQAEFPQRPIIVSAYDTHNNKLFVWVREGDLLGGKYLKESDHIAEICQNEMEKTYPVESVEVNTTITQGIMDDLLYYMSEQNVGYNIVGHNVFFDLGILGTDADDMVGESFNQNQWDGAIQYNDWIILHTRAGAHGRLYQFVNLDTNEVRHTDLNIVDTLTVSDAIRHKSKLADLASQLDIDYCDNQTEHGKITDEYIKYNVDDIRATLQVKDKLKTYVSENLGSDMPLYKIFSSASIGKDALKRMGYDRTHYTPDAVQLCSRSYFGGQTEALKTGELIEGVSYMDILSQYPTTSGLMNLWQYMTAEEVERVESSTDELPQVDLEDLKNEKTWEEISQYYVAIESDSSLLPVRVHDDETETTRVKKANIECDGEIYHYADIVGAMILGDDPDIEIKKVWRVEAKGKQSGLSHTTIGGTTIKATDNLMVRAIEERKHIQHIENDGEKDKDTLALKIVANSCYGITAERINEIIRKGNQHASIVKRHDKAGTFYNPHVATAITAGGRLMLSIGEAVANQNGGEMYYCDTDSLIVDQEVDEEVLEYFNYHMDNPYTGKAGKLDLLEVEDKADKDLRGVCLFATNEKKYSILNSDGKILDFKEHGLGHYSNMRGAESDKKVKRFWSTIINDPRTEGKCSTDQLTGDQLNERMFWSSSASTKSMRQMIENLAQHKVRYGDFVVQTISKSGHDIFYVGIDLDKEIYKITKDGTTVEIERVNDIGDDQKLLAHVVGEFIQDTAHPDGRRNIRITDTQATTKEATDIKQAYEDIFKKALDQKDRNRVLKDQIESVDISSLL